MKRTLGKARVAQERAAVEGYRREKEERSYDRLFNGSADERAKKERERMEKIASSAGGGEEDDAVAAARKVRAVEDDFM